MAQSSRLSDGPTYQFQPLEDSRWNEFLETHPRSSVFHTPEWLRSLYLTYGYQPRVITTSPPGTKLQDGIVFCHVNSWLTGRRLVSIPSSDHCESLAEPENLGRLLKGMEEQLRQDRSDYLDFHSFRVLEFETKLFLSTRSYCFHQLDLKPDLKTLFNNCHKSSTQRKIRRAEREGLTYQRGRSETLVKAFLKLHAMTRRRHQIPPQPRMWFLNLVDSFRDKLTIRVAYRTGHPVAATLTIRHKDTLVFKYGCSDTQLNNLGGTHLLFWKMIEEGKQEGLQLLDLGRSDPQNNGLVTFKDRWGAVKSCLTYSRFAVSPRPAMVYSVAPEIWKARLDRYVLSHLPDRALYIVGSVLYRHAG